MPGPHGTKRTQAAQSIRKGLPGGGNDAGTTPQRDLNSSESCRGACTIDQDCMLSPHSQKIKAAKGNGHRQHGRRNRIQAGWSSVRRKETGCSFCFQDRDESRTGSGRRTLSFRRSRLRLCESFQHLFLMYTKNSLPKGRRTIRLCFH